MKKESILLLAVLSCNPKAVDCTNSSQPCVSTQVTDNSDDHQNTTVNTDNTTINVVNNPPVVNTPEEHADAGATNNGGAGSSGNVAGAGGTNDASIDGGSVDDPEPVVCNSPNAIPTDVRNWFATGANATDWFQLTTADGFSADRCTYTGKFKWFYQGPDGYWESDRSYDNPVSTITIGFTADGFVKGDYHEPTDAYPNGYVLTQELSIAYCYAGLSKGSPLTFDPTYRYYNCLTYGSGNHPRQMYVFRGTWVDDRPIMTQQVYPPNSG